ncbi:MAG: penicillin acylase family protein [Sediminibacterium sp.]
MKTFKRIVLAVLIVVLLLVSAGYFYLNSLQPNYSANLNLPGLKAEVSVLYDNYAIPHLYAQNEEDLFYAFGYIHAQDRLFQMEVLRRLADGRLSEVFGEKALQSDQFFRMLSFREQAKTTIATVYKDPNSPFVKAAKAYLKGINQYIKLGKTPIEFTIAGIPKTEFTLEDMEIITGYMGYTFVGAFRSEAIATQIASKYGMDYFNDVLKNWPDSTQLIPVQAGEKLAMQKAASCLNTMANEVTALQNNLLYPPFLGSNGWVIAGSKTQSGKPILSNDTHIAFSQPSVWYEAQLECPGFKIYGNFLAGTPVPALGHSDIGGWGLTMFENDDADFFKEKTNPANANQVWYKDHWEDLLIRKETIQIKSKPSIEFLVKKSRHGYIMNGAFDAVKNMPDPIALWWVYHQFPSQHLQVFYNLSHAKNVTEAAAAVAPLTAPGLNFMWADTAGNIAWWAAGKLPIRPAHVNPALILDGSTGLDDPIGWLDFKQNPQILNPARGVLYTANNQPQDMGTGLVAGYYVPANRAQRIEELIFTNKKDWTEASVRNVINDVQTSSYASLLKAILPVVELNKLTPSAKNSLAILSQWNGSHGLENIEPTIYYQFIHLIYQYALEDELGKESFQSFENQASLKRNTASFFQNNQSKWWDDIHTPDVETRAGIFTKALNEATDRISKQLGNNTANWQWKKVHSIEHKHPLGILPLVGKWFNVGPMPINGGRETINNLDFNLDSSGLYKVVYGPALRRVIDFGNPAAAMSVNPTGQSGFFFNNHYQDQATMFAEGGKRPELTDRKQIEKIAIGTTIFHCN